MSQCLSSGSPKQGLRHGDLLGALERWDAGEGEARSSARVWSKLSPERGANHRADPTLKQEASI